MDRIFCWHNCVNRNVDLTEKRRQARWSSSTVRGKSSGFFVTQSYWCADKPTGIEETSSTTLHNIGNNRCYQWHDRGLEAYECLLSVPCIECRRTLWPRLVGNKNMEHGPWIEWGPKAVVYVFRGSISLFWLKSSCSWRKQCLISKWKKLAIAIFVETDNGSCLWRILSFQWHTCGRVAHFSHLNSVIFVKMIFRRCKHNAMVKIYFHVGSCHGVWPPCEQHWILRTMLQIHDSFTLSVECSRKARSKSNRIHDLCRGKKNIFFLLHINLFEKNKYSTQKKY